MSLNVSIDIYPFRNPAKEQEIDKDGNIDRGNLNETDEIEVVGKNCASAFCRFKFDFAVSWCGQKPFNIYFIVLLPVWHSCRSYDFTSSCDYRDYCFISAVLYLVSVIVGYNSRVP